MLGPVEAAAAVSAQRAKNANQHADDYMLVVVLFACSLFFAGVSTQLEGLGPRIALLALGLAVFLGSAIWIATLPTQVTT